MHYAVERGDSLTRIEAFQKARELSRGGRLVEVRLADDFGFAVGACQDGCTISGGQPRGWSPTTPR